MDSCSADTTRRGLRRAYRACIFLCLLMADLPSAWSGSLGTRPYANYEGLRVTYTPDPVAYCACSEMTVTVTTAIGKPSMADRELEFVFFIAGHYRSSVAYRTRLSLQEGATSATTKLFLRQPHSYANWLVDVRENGRSIVFPEPTINYVSANQAVQGLDCCEIVSPGQPAGNSVSFDFSGNGLNLVKVSLADAPTDWRAYLRFGLVIWTLDQLATATDQQRQALSSFVLSGGTLILPSMNAEQLGELDSYLLARTELAEADYRWEPLNFNSKQYGEQRPHGGGTILCLTSIPASLVNIVKSSFQYPVSDLVNDATIDDSWFWRNLVQSVGKTPVWTFNILVILFATVVGPGLLVFTNRVRQRTLMLLLVPAISAILTILILLYNVMREGFDTRGRITSIQFFDAHTGLGHAWSRQSFFSGAPPAAGLEYSLDCLLNPVDTSQGQYGMGDPRDRVSYEIFSDGQAQYLRGWLAPRSQQQLSVGHALRQPILPFRVEQLADNRIRLTNLSPSELTMLVLRGAADQYYFLSQLAANQAIELEPLRLHEVESQLYGQWRDYFPEAPPEIDTTQTRIGTRARYWYGYSGRSFNDPLEKALNSRALVGALSKFGFLLITRDSTNLETPFPKEIFDNEQNFHLMMGANPW